MSLIFLFLNVLSLMIDNSFSLYQNEQLLTGKIISSDISYTTILNAFDNDTQTSFTSFFTKCWIGLDLLTEHHITKIGWAQNTNDKSNYILGIFEGANNDNFNDSLPIYMIKEEQKINEMNYVDIFITKPFRYVRYVGPHNKYCIISEIEIYGYNDKTEIFNFRKIEESFYFQPTNLPLLVMHSNNPNEYYDTIFNMDCYIYIINNNKIEAEGKANRKVRGNGSSYYPKLSYKVKFSEKKIFLNFSTKSKKWNLISNYIDKTLIRNLLSYEISRLFEMNYTVNCKPIDVMCNGEYLGNFIICENIEVKKNKINITKMNDTCIHSPEINGGYLLEIDSYSLKENSKIISFKYNYITIKYPKEKNILPEQHLYLENKFNEMERKLFKGDLSLIDIDSFARYFLINELTGNGDAYWCIKMYKDRNDEHFYFGPVWDFDLAFDNDKLIVPNNNKKAFIFEYGLTTGATSKFIEKILIDENVIKKIKLLWKHIYENKLKDDCIFKIIDELTKYINESQRLNFIRWDILGKVVENGNPVIKYTFENEINFLKEFLKNRTDWMNKYINSDDLFDKYKNNDGKIIKIRYIILAMLLIIFL